MAVLTGADGKLLYQNQAVAKCRDWSLSINKDALEDTCLASTDRSYVEGLRGTTGSATILYDPSDGSGTDLLNTIFETAGSTQEDVRFVFNTKGDGQIECRGFLTSVSPSVSVGSVTAVSINFQVNGKPTGGF